MVIQEIVSQHAEEAAFLWTMRNRAVADPTYSLKSLATLDDRVEAHLDGLRIAGDAGWTLCRTKLENGGAGEVFPLAVLAFETADRQRMLDALTVGCVSETTRRGLISALGWIDHGTVAPWIDRLLVAKAAEHRAIGVAACAVHRADPRGMLTASVDDPDPILRARSLRAVGELKRHDLLKHVRAHLTDDDPGSRFWASWTLALNRDRAGLESLAQWIGRDDRFGQTALQLSLRAMKLDDGRHWIRSMAKDPALRRSAVLGTGILGDPSTVPWLISNMQTPALARAAGEAFSMITGVDLEDKNFDQAGPAPDPDGNDESSDEPIGVDDDSHLPWPQPALIEEWWQAHETDFQPGVRYLAGRLLATETARQVLALGKQRQRAAAAIEIAFREPEEILFEVRGRGSKQRRQLEAIGRS